MGISDRIEAFITALIEAEEDMCIDLKRNELAEIFNCVPSQINYVISTRFNPERGYAVESRRGGGGYLRIRRVAAHEESPLFSFIKASPSSLSLAEVQGYISDLTRMNAISTELASLIWAATSDRSLPIPQPDKDRVRASIFKNLLLELI